MTAALKPCPFCGSEPTLIDRPQGPMLVGAFVECDTCSASQGIKPTAGEAIAAWNRRHDAAHPAQGGEVKDVPMPEPCNKGQSLMGGTPKPWEPLFTADQLRAYGDARVAAVQEKQK